MLKRLLDRGMPGPESLPTRTPLSEPELRAWFPREVDLFDGLAPAQLKEISLTLPMAVGTTQGEGRGFADALCLADIGIPACAFLQHVVDPGTPFAAGPLLRLS